MGDESLLVACQGSFDLHADSEEVQCLGIPAALEKLSKATEVIDQVVATCLKWNIDDHALEAKQLEVGKAASVFTQCSEEVAELYSNLLDAEDSEIDSVRKGKRSQRGLYLKFAGRYASNCPPRGEQAHLVCHHRWRRGLSSDGAMASGDDY